MDEYEYVDKHRFDENSDQLQKNDCETSHIKETCPAMKSTILQSVICSIDFVKSKTTKTQ